MSLAVASLLIVEDNATLRRAIARALAAGCERLEEADSCAAARERIASAADAFAVVLTDLRLPDGSGLDVLGAARARDARSAVVLMTAHGSVEAAVEAMRRGAVDFLQKPFEIAELEARVLRAASHARLVGEVAELRAERGARRSRSALVGRHPSFVAAASLAERVAPTRSTVLVMGETGTGKELIAEPRALRLAARGRSVRQGELRGAARDAARIRAVRARARRVHRRGSPAHRPLRAGERRHALPRRDRRAPARDPGEAAARPARRRSSSASAERARCAVDVRVVAATNRELQGAIARGRVPRGPLLPSQRDHDRAARRCARAATTSTRWRITSSPSSRPSSGDRALASAPPRSRASAPTAGPATCASCAT